MRRAPYTKKTGGRKLPPARTDGDKPGVVKSLRHAKPLIIYAVHPRSGLGADMRAGRGRIGRRVAVGAIEASTVHHRGRNLRVWHPDAHKNRSIGKISRGIARGSRVSDGRLADVVE